MRLKIYHYEYLHYFNFLGDCRIQFMKNIDTIESSETFIQYFSFLGELCTEHDRCANNPCGQNGKCKSLPYNYRCECDPGFTGPNCQIDVNECQMQRRPCNNRGQCTNTLGSYQ